jgi:hypothetical protein
MARTANRCLPAPSPLIRSGDVHFVNGASSTRHSKVPPASLEANAKSLLVSSVVEPSVRPEAIVVWGAVPSTVKVRVEAAAFP